MEMELFGIAQGRLLSDMSAAELTRSHKPPRLVHPLVQAGLKQVPPCDLCLCTLIYNAHERCF